MTEDERTESRHRAMFRRKHCEICGETSVALARTGFWSCNEHLDEPKPDPPVYDYFYGRRLIH